MSASPPSAPHSAPASTARRVDTRDAVAQAQRGRMLAAVVQAVAERGYAATTVAHVIAGAGVSRRTFYEQFTDLDDCFVAAYASALAGLQQAVRQASAQAVGQPLAERVRAPLAAYLATLGAVPGAARAFAAAAVGASERVAALRSAALHQWVLLWRTTADDCRTETHGPVSDAELLAMVGGVEELVRDAVQRGADPGGPALREAAVGFALAVLRAR